MRRLHLFWWAPRRSVRLARPERQNLPAWSRLALRTGRPFLNFGDELSRAVVAEAAGLPVDWAAPERAELVAVGSVLEIAAGAPGRVTVWGTGLRGDPTPDRREVLLSNIERVLAVRGPRTRDALGLPADTPLGDPGLLAYRHVTRAARPREVLVIPHFTQWNTGAGRQQVAAAAGAGLRVVEPSVAPLAMLRRIAAAQFVYSASLHGVIVAHALGVPAQLLRAEEVRPPEPLWKYEDYFDSMALPVEWSSWGEVLGRPRDSALVDLRGDQAPDIRDRAHALGEGLTAALHAWVGRRDPALRV